MELNGLPLHVLVIHGAVVFGPLAALLAVGYAAPVLRERLRWPLAVTAVLAGLFVVSAYITGQDFLDRNPALGQLPAVADHQRYAVWALVATLALVVIALVATLAPLSRGQRYAVDVLLVIAAIATAITVFLTGDAGARAVWGGMTGQ